MNSLNKAFVEFDLEKLEENVDEIKRKCKNVIFIFPVKCCTNDKVLELMNKKIWGFDVSNASEYNLIKNLNLESKFISVTGPLSYTLIDKDNIHVTVNNLEFYKDGLGIRINFNNNSNFEESHFGVNPLDISDAIKSNVEYIHFHNSDKRTIKKCEYIIEEIKNLLSVFPNIKYLNIGGHLEDLKKEEGIKYINNVRKIVPSKIKLIVEVGDFLFKNCGTLYTEVVDSKIVNGKQIVILNFSKMANQRWVYPILKKEQLKNKIEYDTTFYGCSCCEVDTFLETRCKRYYIGEKLIFSNISPYSYEWNNSFNGVNKIDFFFK